MLEMALVENIQRKDLDPIEVALSYQRLIEEIDLTQEEMSATSWKKTFNNYQLFTFIKIRSNYPNWNA